MDDERKEFLNHKFVTGYILNGLWRPVKSLRLFGTESRVHANDLLLCHDVFKFGHLGFTMAKVDVPRAFKNPSRKKR